MKKLFIFAVSLVIGLCITPEVTKAEAPVAGVFTELDEMLEELYFNPPEIREEPEPVEIEEIKAEERYEEIENYANADVNLIALVTMAEAEGESELGKRLVIDTILNRITSDIFPDTASDVIYQKGQFTSVWNGRINKVTATEETCALVYDEMLHRTNSQVLYFTARHYGNFGTPSFSEGNHYFCTE